MTDELTDKARRRATGSLDQAADNLDAPILAALAAARARAAEAAPARGWQPWAWGGTGLAVAAAFALVMLRPAPQPVPLPMEPALLVADAQMLQVADDALFLMWLEETQTGE